MLVRMHAIHPSIHLPVYHISDLANKLDDEGGAPRQCFEGRALAAPRSSSECYSDSVNEGHVPHLLHKAFIPSHGLRSRGLPRLRIASATACASACTCREVRLPRSRPM